MGDPDLDDTIKRLQTFEVAGADVLYAPDLKDMATIKAVVSAVSKPVNVVMSHADTSITAADLAVAGVKRISVGGSIARYAMAAFLKAGREMKEEGGFTFIKEAAPSKALKATFLTDVRAQARATCSTKRPLCQPDCIGGKTVPAYVRETFHSWPSTDCAFSAETDAL